MQVLLTYLTASRHAAGRPRSLEDERWWLADCCGDLLLLLLLFRRCRTKTALQRDQAGASDLESRFEYVWMHNTHDGQVDWELYLAAAADVFVLRVVCVCCVLAVSQVMRWGHSSGEAHASQLLVLATK